MASFKLHYQGAIILPSLFNFLHVNIVDGAVTGAQEEEGAGRVVGCDGG